MILTLLAVSLNDQALTRPITARFDASGGTIGRADHSTMALPDPERFISRKQAEIVFVGDAYMIRNVGAANPITVSSRTLSAGESTPLRDGDEVRIGGYLLRAECPEPGMRPGAAPIERTHASGPRPIVSGAAMPRPPIPPMPPRVVPPLQPASPPAPSSRDNPFADLLGGSPSEPLAGIPQAAPASGDDPFADLLGAPAAPAPFPRATPVAPVAPAAPGRKAAAPAPIAPTRPYFEPPGAPAPRPAAAPARAVPAAWAQKAPAPSLDDDPFAGLMPAASGLDPALGGVGSTARGGAGASARLPDDFDPFASHATPSMAPGTDPLATFTGTPGALAGGTPSSPFAPAAPADAADPFADLFGDRVTAGGVTPGGAGIDQAFGLGQAGGDDDALARFVGGGPASPAAGGGLPTDPLLLFGGDAGSPAAGPGSAGLAGAPAQTPALPDDHLPALHGAYTPPLVAKPPREAPAAFIPATVVVQPQPAVPSPHSPPRAEPPRPAPAQPAAAARAAVPAAASPSAAAASAAGGDAALWRAFCEGAGVQLPPLTAAAAENRMRHVGRIFRAAVEGTLQLISVRASTKHEMRASVTQIQASSNNPLKFAPDAATGVEQLLSPPQRGFMDGPAAMDDAMLDLVGHSIGTVAGMRAAIEGMLDRFDPAALEDKLGAGSMIGNLLPMNRKARLWELYLQHHGRIRDEAQEDFHTLFGRAFVAAYEQQVDRLEQQRQQQRRASRPPPAPQT